jgi:hypothetical protein
MTALAGHRIRRLSAATYVVALSICVLVAALVAILIVATGGLETIDPPLNPGLFVVFGVSAVVGFAAGVVWVLTADLGRRRLLALPGVVVSGFQWWGLLVSGSTNGMGVTSTDVVSVMATRPAYLLWILVGLVIVGLPGVAKRPIGDSHPTAAAESPRT